MLSLITEGFAAFFGPLQIVMSLIGVFLGIIAGVLPGVGPMIGIVLLTPICIQMDPVAGMGLLIGMFVGGSCGGAISAILLRIPGTPLAACTLMDGYPMAAKGKAPQAVGLAISASALGGLIGGIGLMFVSPFLAKVAVKFGPPEYFSLALIGLLAIAVIARESTIKGLLSACLGLLLATVGTDPISGDDRFTFDWPSLMGGFGIIPVLVGLFAISEMFIQIRNGVYTSKLDLKAFRPPLSSITQVLKKGVNMVRSSLIGTFIGALPAVGGVAASFIAYAVAKASSKESHLFGTGKDDGIIASEAANNATCGGALIPALSLAIPGDPATAVLLGALILLGLLPGPMLFQDNPDVAGGLFFSYLCANVFLLFVGLLLTPFFVAVLKVKKNRLIPIILLLSVVGTFAVQSSLFDIWSMWFFGLVGFFMRMRAFPLAPFVIARVLSPVIEPAFRRSLIISGGDFSIFVERPISLVILILAFFLLLWAVLPPEFLERVKAGISGIFRTKNISET